MVFDWLRSRRQPWKDSKEARELTKVWFEFNDVNGDWVVFTLLHLSDDPNASQVQVGDAVLAYSENVSCSGEVFSKDGDEVILILDPETVVAGTRRQ